MNIEEVVQARLPKVMEDLAKAGIKDIKSVQYNPSYEKLYEDETNPALTGYEKGRVTELGAVDVFTGVYTGRSPKDKFIVKDKNNEDKVWWTTPEFKNDNKPATEEAWKACKDLAIKELSGIPGVDNLKADATVRKVCTEFAAAGKVVAAICAAPSVLAAFGILQGKKATVYPGMEDKLTAAGAEYTGLPITLDGNIITGEALGAAIPFALALASRLAGQQASNAVKQGIVYRY